MEIKSKAKDKRYIEFSFPNCDTSNGAPKGVLTLGDPYCPRVSGPFRLSEI